MKTNSALHTDYKHAHIQIHCLLVALLLFFFCYLHNDIALILVEENSKKKKNTGHINDNGY